MQPIAIHACNPGPLTGGGNWTWFIPGGLPTLIDAGAGDSRHLSAVAHALAGHRLSRVLVTHGHGDHAAGAASLARRFPGAQFLKMPWQGRDTRWNVEWMPLADGDVVAAGDTRLTAVHTPGHAPDHLCFWHETTRTIFSGDLVIQGEPVWIPTQLRGDMVAYLDSLRRVLALEPRRLVPAHGPVIEDARGVLQHCLDDRQRRERQVVDALAGGATTPRAIAERVYRGATGVALARTAEHVLAHLVKLQKEGRARRDAGGWRISES